MRKLFYIILGMLIASCVGGTASYPSDSTPVDSDSVPTIVNIVDTAIVEDSTLMDITPKQVDSLVFRLTHHYSENFNFLVKADSLKLIPREGDLIMDTCLVYKDDVIAVAAIKTIPGDSIDSIWVKVASNQTTMGWIPESELLKGTTPDDLISERWTHSPTAVSSGCLHSSPSDCSPSSLEERRPSTSGTPSTFPIFLMRCKVPTPPYS